jgi:hypothetical protein
MKHAPPLMVYGFAALTVGAPVIEAIFSSAEECRLSAPCSWGMNWSPHGHEDNHDPRPPSIRLTLTAATTGSISAGSIPGYAPWSRVL